MVWAAVVCAAVIWLHDRGRDCLVLNLIDTGLEAEGLFRISGGASRLQHCKDELDRGVVPDFAHWNDPHVVAGLLKQYVRELPEPLIPFEQYDDFLALNENGARYTALPLGGRRQ